MLSPRRGTVTPTRQCLGDNKATSDAAAGFKIGSPVWVRRKGQPLAQGLVAYMGSVDFADGADWVGVELTGSSVGQGKNDGSVAGKTYFQCVLQHPKSGLFVRKSCVSLRPKNSSTSKTPTTMASPIRSRLSSPPPLSSPPLLPSSPPRTKRSRTQKNPAAATPPVSRSPPKPRNKHRASTGGTKESGNYRDAQQERYEALLRWKQAKRDGRRHSSSNYELTSSSPLTSSSKSLVGLTIHVDPSRSMSVGRASPKNRDSADGSLRTVPIPQRDRYRRHRSAPCIRQYQAEVEDEDMSMASTGDSTISSYTRKSYDYDHELNDLLGGIDNQEPTIAEESPESTPHPVSPAHQQADENVPPLLRMEKGGKGRKRRYAGMHKEPTGKAQLLRERLRSLEKWRLENGRMISDDEGEQEKL